MPKTAGMAAAAAAPPPTTPKKAGKAEGAPTPKRGRAKEEGRRRRRRPRKSRGLRSRRRRCGSRRAAARGQGGAEPLSCRRRRRSPTWWRRSARRGRRRAQITSMFRRRRAAERVRRGRRRGRSILYAPCPVVALPAALEAHARRGARVHASEAPAGCSGASGCAAAGHHRVRDILEGHSTTGAGHVSGNARVGNPLRTRHVANLSDRDGDVEQPHVGDGGAAPSGSDERSAPFSGWRPRARR